MKDSIKAKRQILVIVALLACIIALISGCKIGGRQEGQLFGSDENPTGSYEYRGTGVAAEPDEDCDDCCLPSFEDFELVVATVNGIEITALDVMMEFNWAANMLQWDYVMMFPEDTEFNFDRIFRDDLTFGQVLRQEATRMAALVKLYYDFAARNDIEWDEFGFEHPAIIAIYAIIDNPDMFAQFESYMPEDTFAAVLEKAEELLERALAGEDFDTLIQTYGEDPGMITYPDGYTFVRGDMVPEFESATIELEIGEISGLVISDFGIHIIKRTEPDPENIMSQSRATPDVAAEDLLGAQHILLMGSELSSEDMMVEAVLYAFEAKQATADIVFLAALDDIPLG